MRLNELEEQRSCKGFSRQIANRATGPAADWVCGKTTSPEEWFDQMGTLQLPKQDPPSRSRTMQLLTTLEQVLARYQTKLEQQQAKVKGIAGRWSKVGYLRGFLFLLSLVPLFLALNKVAGVSTPWVWVAGLIFVAFLAVAVYHERMQIEMRKASLLANMHSESIARVDRDWKNLRTIEVDIPRSFRPLASQRLHSAPVS